MSTSNTSAEGHWSRLAYDRHDLDNCASEPIQFCGAIQAGAYFLSVNSSTDLIEVASDNCVELFGVDSVDDVLGKNVFEFIKPEGTAAPDLEVVTELSAAGVVKVSVRPHDRTYHASFYKSPGGTCVDLEPMLYSGGDLPIRYVDELRKLVHQVDSESDLPLILDRGATQVRKLAGFDRVMIYRFEANWDGVVVAEAKSPQLEPFLGLTYPESDIPAQARQLYMEQRYRMIVSTDTLPVPIRTRPGLGRSEFDLTCSAFRAVSPIHVQYLKNMGVRASFSVPIRVQGRLWGLIACHHYAGAVHLPREIRSSCELAAQVLSGRIADHISDRRLRLQNRVYEFSQKLLTVVSEGNAAVKAFAEESRELLDLTHSTGAYVRIGGEEVYLGDTPSPDCMRGLLDLLSPLQGVSLWKTRNLREALPRCKVDVKAVGALAVPLSLGFDDLFVWFRPEAVEEVQWAGKPKAQKGPGVLEPRASFAKWTEIVRDRAREWSEPDLEAAQYILFTFVRGIFKKAADLSKANSELEHLTRAKDEFIGMVSHELRTPLGVMIGWIDILRDEGLKDPKQLQAVEIIDRNARLQINLINDLLDISRIISGKMRLNLQPDIDISQVTREVVTALGPTAMSKNLDVHMHFEGPTPMSADPERMRQVIWNLLSNAIKFTPKGGRIDVRVHRESSAYDIEVSDSGIGIPPDQLHRIFNRFSQAQEGHAKIGGLGLGLSIVKALVEMHGGKIVALSAGFGKGATFRATLPIFALRSEVIGPAERRDAKPADTVLADLRILVAEDQPEAALALRHLLEKMGGVVTMASNGREAFEILKKDAQDLLLSDIGMPEGDGFELITRWRSLERERKSTPLPAIALTAYATSRDRTRCLEAGFQNHVPKPVDREELIAVIHSLGLGRAASASPGR